MMTVQPKFSDAKPVSLRKFPVVLRFKGVWPRDLRRFIFHDLRRGGDLEHVDLGRTKSNAVLFGKEDWDQVIRDDVAQMKLHNFEEHIAALEAKSRKSEAEKVDAAGPADPWRACSEGPLREGILTVGKDWFGGSGQDSWKPKRVKEFKKTAMKFLTDNFPDGQLRYASGHFDEEAFHIHFVIATWVEKISANRGRQFLLQPSANPLIADYELAQNVAGAAFSEIGISRGVRRAEARRRAQAEDQPVPEKRWHVPPSDWRAEERRKAQEEKTRLEAEAKMTVEDGRDLAKAVVRKSRKRAIKESAARKRQATQETAEAKRALDKLVEERARQQTQLEILTVDRDRTDGDLDAAWEELQSRQHQILRMKEDEKAHQAELDALNASAEKTRCHLAELDARAVGAEEEEERRRADMRRLEEKESAIAAQEEELALKALEVEAAEAADEQRGSLIEARQTEVALREQRQHEEAEAAHAREAELDARAGEISLREGEVEGARAELVKEAKEVRLQKEEFEVSLAAIDHVVAEVVAGEVKVQDDGKLYFKNPEPIMAAPKSLRVRLLPGIRRLMRKMDETEKRASWVEAMMTRVQRLLGRPDLPQEVEAEASDIQRDWLP